MEAVLLSGGVDSTAIAFWKRPDIAVHINYGQSCAKAEQDCAADIAEQLNIPLEIVRLDCAGLGSGSLAGKAPLKSAPSEDWWPYRNQLLVTLAAVRLASYAIDRLLIGTVATDRQFADGTPDFVGCLSSLTSMQETRLSVAAPAIDLTSSQLVRIAGLSREVLSRTHSCHHGDLACGQCRGCYKRAAVLEDLGYAKDLSRST